MYTPKGYRGFKSLLLRHIKVHPIGWALLFIYDNAPTEVGAFILRIALQFMVEYKYSSQRNGKRPGGNHSQISQRIDNPALQQCLSGQSGGLEGQDFANLLKDTADHFNAEPCAREPTGQIGHQRTADAADCLFRQHRTQQKTHSDVQTGGGQ